MLRRLSVFGIAALMVVLAVPAVAQDFRGRINGTVTDNSGAVLPGVTVTATSPALIQPQSQITGEDGTFRFIALPAGTYVLNFELQGFQTLKREGIRVVINTTLTVDAQLSVATLQESVTVTGESPVVDTSTTTVGTNFTNELLTEIPNARDIWAAMAQAPGLQVTGYDVGGSHTGTQTGYVTYGVSQQNTTRIEGVNTTRRRRAPMPATSTSDRSRSSSSAERATTPTQDVPGASLNITVKSGGDRFQGTCYSDYESDSTISNNVPDEFRTPNTKDGNGFFTQRGGRSPDAAIRPRSSTTSTSTSAGRSGKDKAWFFYSYRLNDQYQTIINSPELARSKLTQPLHVQGHVPAEQEQPDHRLLEQARKAPGQARHRSDDPAVGGATTSRRGTIRGRSSGRASSATVCSSTCSRELVQLLPAAAADGGRGLPGCVLRSRAHRADDESVPSTAAQTTSIRIRSVSSRSCTCRCRTSRKAGTDRTTSSSGMRVAASGRCSDSDQPFDIFYQRSTGGAGVRRPVQHTCHAHQSRSTRTACSCRMAGSSTTGSR